MHTVIKVFIRFLSNFIISGRQRIMPLSHVDYLLDIYGEYLNKRMLESGRLSKGCLSSVSLDLF